jgi:hypothetical protein
MAASMSSPIVDTRLPYRVGSPMLPVLPLETELAATIKNEGLVFSSIKNILDEEGVKTFRIQCCRRYSPNASLESRKLLRKTLLVETNFNECDYRRCVQSVIQIRSLLNDYNLYCDIEVLDVRAHFGLVTSPLNATNDALIQAWNAFYPSVLQLLDTRKWITIDVVRRAFEAPGSPSYPTVVISAADASEADWWNRILPSVKRLAPKGLGVELLQCEQLSWLSGREGRTQTHVTEESYGVEAFPGCSVGQHGRTEAGTLGTFIQMDADNAYYGITNWHVIFGKDSTTKAGHDASTPIAPSSHIARHRKVLVKSPADTDHKKLATRYTEDIEDCIRVLQDEMKNGASSRVCTKLLSKIEKYADIRARTQVADRTLGAVIAGSGKRTCDHHNSNAQEIRTWSKVMDSEQLRSRPGGPTLASQIGNVQTLQWYLDWALIDVEPPRIADLALGSTPPRVHIRGEAQATQYVRINPHQAYAVAKKGRTTAWTTGTISQIASVMNLRYNMSSVIPVDLSHKSGTVALAWGIVPDNRHQDFLAGGDSGSVILLNNKNIKNTSAKIVGLGFASNTVTMVSYMQPMDLVVADVERVTGRTWAFPTYGGLVQGETPED